MIRVENETKKPKIVSPPKPKPVVVPDQRDDRLVKTQMEATLALTEVAANAMNNPQLTQLLSLLSQQNQTEPNRSKRLVINRDQNGLIESIDIEEV